MLNERTYKEWAAKDLWTVEEAIKLIIEHDPEFKLNGQHCRDELYLGQFENGFDEIAEQRGEKYHEIEDLLRRSLQAGSITIIAQPNESGAFSSYNNEFDDDGIRVESAWASKVCVAPKVFIEWAKQKNLSVPDLLTTPDSIIGESIPTAKPEYISPYLKYMLHASAELKIDADDKRKKQEIIDWLKQNEPEEYVPLYRCHISMSRAWFSMMGAGVIILHLPSS